MYNIDHQALIETLNFLVMPHAMTFDFTISLLPDDLIDLSMDGLTINHSNEWQEKGVKIPVCYVIYLTGKHENELEKIVFDLIFRSHNAYIKSIIKIPILLLGFSVAENSVDIQEKISKELGGMVFQLKYTDFAEYIARAKYLLEFS